MARRLAAGLLCLALAGGCGADDGTGVRNLDGDRGGTGTGTATGTGTGTGTGTATGAGG
ncbi:MAG TPA: hypothetical protein VG452_01825 [Egibacteraceae bacterium]|nr:hypothetical protein [Egibacteraceae bacterium]